MAAEVRATGGYDDFVNTHLGEIVIDQAGDYTLQMNPDPQHWQPINLRKVELRLK